MTGWIVLLTLAACFVGVGFYVVAPADAELLLERLLDELYARSPRGRRARADARRELQRRVLPRLVLVEGGALSDAEVDRLAEVRAEQIERELWPCVFDEDTDVEGGDAA